MTLRPRSECLLVILVKAAAGAAAWASGFRAVSDDDFARVVIAQRFAAHPRLDPSGTSWLPLPFWLDGALMRGAGDTSLAFARAIHFALGLGAAALVLAAARLLVADRRPALVGALAAAVFPWSARLGVATVPELPAAALSLFGVATLARRGGRLRVAGAASLLCACLCRYEPWLLAALFGLFCAGDWLRRHGRPVALLAAMALAALGPALWIGHNALAYGDPFHFLVRVVSYRRALARDPLRALFDYPLAMLREEPELWIAFGSCVIARAIRLGSQLTRPVVSLTAVVPMLSLLAARGAAPTHHSGRALLAVWLAVAIGAGAGLARAFARSGQTRLWLGASLGVTLPVGALVVRPWYAHLDALAPRGDEVSIGHAVASLPSGARVLIEVRDYGYFAVLAASGRPDAFVLDRSLDPRVPAAPSSFSDATALRARLRDCGASYVAGTASGASSRLDAPLASAGSWRLWRAR